MYHSTRVSTIRFFRVEVKKVTDDAFLGYFVAGLDISGHRVTARIGSLAPHEAVAASLSSTNRRQFIVQVDHGGDIPIVFEPDEDLASRMSRVDAAVERWVQLHPPI